jgi:hypothetical protein
MYRTYYYSVCRYQGPLVLILSLELSEIQANLVNMFEVRHKFTDCENRNRIMDCHYLSMKTNMTKFKRDSCFVLLATKA